VFVSILILHTVI